MTDIRIETVENNKQLMSFIGLPWSLYKDDPNWIAPLIFEQKQRLTDKNPYFEHAQVRLWLAYRGAEVVGRISAQIDSLYEQRHGKKVGYFGMFEAINDQEVTNALFETAETWLRDNSVVAVHGPYNLGVNEECGMLVKGFDTPPQVMMGHALPYYAELLDAAGYRKAKGLIAYHMAPDFEAPPVMSRLLRIAEKSSLHVRSFNRKEKAKELEIMRDIFNDAWENNWGFVPFTKAEFADVGDLLTALLPDENIAIAELDGRPVAFNIALPDINQAARDLNGRLLPFGWIKLLWRLKVKTPTRARVPLMGVRKEFHHTRLGPGLAFAVIEPVRKALADKGVEDVEMSWILEDNDGMRNIIETIGGTDYKHYNIYEKTL